MAKKETLKKNKKGGTTTAPNINNTAATNGGQSFSAPGGVNGAQPSVDPNAPPIAQIGNTTLDRSQMSAEQLTQAQIEQAIKESSDPSSKLKKLRSPLSFKGCLLNLLILVVITIALILLISYIMLDKETFNLWYVIKDMLDQFGITGFFTKIGNWFKKIFGGKNLIMFYLSAFGII